MKVDALWVWTMFCVFTRCSAMLLSSPIFGASVPTKVRVLFAAAFAAALGPMVHDHFTVPTDMNTLVMTLLTEIMMGLAIGFTIQLLMTAAQTAGSYLDTQLGLNQMHILNPVSGQTVSILGQFHFMLAMVVFFLINGHHVMLQAFVHSYDVQSIHSAAGFQALFDHIIGFIGQLSLLSLQMAAPAAAVAVIVDAGASIVNKAIPQMPVYFVAAGIKSGVGLIALSLGLPLFIAAIHAGTDHMSRELASLISAGAR